MPDTTAPARGRTRLKAAGAAIAAGALLAVALPASPAAAAETEYTGTLASGAEWSFVVPDDWNGTVLLYSHGYRPSFAGSANPAQIAPNDGTEELLLDMGYALVGSGYAARGWALPTAVDDQLGSLDAALDVSGVEPEHILAYGTSMGGLVTGRIAETAGDVIEGALPTCGLMEGGVDLNNYQLDAAHAINQLIDPEHDIQIEGYGVTGLGSAFAATGALLGAVGAAQATPEGQARNALAAALFHLPGDDSGSLQEWQESMYGLLQTTIGFVTAGRYDIETAAGGNGTWNAGVDYVKLFQSSEDRKLVEKLYKQAGLDLKADLELLTETADIEADAGSVETLFGHSGLTGDLQMPVLSLHTTIDILAPVQVEEEYAEDVRGQGDAALLRQMFVERDGHCAFTPAEIAAGIVVLEERVVTGHWSGASSSVPKLNKLAASLDESGSAFVSVPPQEFLADRNMM